MFEIGDTIISVVESSFLKKYGKYKVQKIFNDFISIGNSNMLHHKNDFISLSEYRKQKINKLKLNGF